MHIISIAWILLATRLGFVSAANEVVFVFNNGFTTSSGASCSSSEHTKITAVFGSSGRRALRGSDNSIDNSTAVDDSRDLLFGRKCADLCQGYATGTCRAKGCLNFRDLAEDEQGEHGEQGEQGGRNLQVSCTTEINNLHNKLDTVMSQVSTNCKNYMSRSRRRATCLPDYRYGNVQGIRVWRVSGTNQYSQIHFVAPGETAYICQGLFFNIETLVEPCVESVDYQMWGPNGYYRGHHEGDPPYALYGDDGTVLKGRYLTTPGWYTVWMIPDGDYSKEQWFDIHVFDYC